MLEQQPRQERVQVRRPRSPEQRAEKRVEEKTWCRTPQCHGMIFTSRIRKAAKGNKELHCQGCGEKFAAQEAAGSVERIQLGLKPVPKKELRKKKAPPSDRTDTSDSGEKDERRQVKTKQDTDTDNDLEHAQSEEHRCARKRKVRKEGPKKKRKRCREESSGEARKHKKKDHQVRGRRLDKLKEKLAEVDSQSKSGPPATSPFDAPAPAASNSDQGIGNA